MTRKERAVIRAAMRWWREHNAYSYPRMWERSGDKQLVKALAALRAKGE